MQSLRASLDGSRQQRGQIDKLLTTMRADVSSLPPGAAGMREKAALHDRSLSAYQQELKALREEHDDYEALKLKHASAAAQLVMVSEQRAAAWSAQQGLEFRLAESQQKLAEADATAQERLRAITVSLEAAVAASARHQAEHVKLQADLTAMQQQLAAAESHADELRSAKEHALQERMDQAIAADQAGQDSLAKVQDELGSATRRADAAEVAVQQLEIRLAALQTDNAALQRASEDYKLEASEHGTQYMQFSKQLEDAAAALATKANALALADEERARQGRELESTKQQLSDLHQSLVAKTDALAAAVEETARQQQELDSLRHQLPDLHESLAAKTDALAVADGDRARQARELDSLRQQVLDLQQAHASRMSSLTAAEGDRASQNKELEFTRHQLSDLQQVHASEQEQHGTNIAMLKQELADLQRAHADTQGASRQLQAVQQDLMSARAEAAASAERQGELEQQLLEQQQQQDAHASATASMATAAEESHAVAELQSQLKVEQAKAEATFFARDRMKAQLHELQSENLGLKNALEQLEQQLQSILSEQISPAESIKTLDAVTNGKASVAEARAPASSRQESKQHDEPEEWVQDAEATPSTAFVTLGDGSQLEAAAVQEMQRTLRASTQEQQVLKQEIAALRGELGALQASPAISSLSTWPARGTSNSQDLAHLPPSFSQPANGQPLQASR